MSISKQSDCCAPEKNGQTRNVPEPSPHPDHMIQVKRLNRVIGQLLGVKRMIEDRRYCPDILTQTRAAASALKAMEMVILETHLRHCVAEAVSAPDPSHAAKKIEELVDVVGRF